MGMSLRILSWKGRHRHAATVVMALKAMSKQTVLEAIAAARARVGKPLLPREWGDVAGCEEAQILRAMQFNVLAEGLSSRSTDIPPFPEAATQVSDGGGFTKVPHDVLDYSVRKHLVLEEVLRVEPDVVALEECDHFEDFFRPALAACGYRGEFCRKKWSPCAPYGYHPDGVALFWKDRFALMSVDRVVDIPEREDLQCCVLVATLQCQSTDEYFCIGATHLKAKAVQENEDIRALQVEALLRCFQAHVDAAPHVPHALIMGDFNTAPYDELGVTAKAVPAVLSYPAIAFRSAYPLDLPFTTAKVRGDHISQHTIDYIFAGPSLRPSRLLYVPGIEELGTVLLPCWEYPSDHFSLVADLIVPARQAKESKC
ncbi:unnamed protein product, partial [Effrenium voratum]